jgi:hypothetical protein
MYSARKHVRTAIGCCLLLHIILKEPFAFFSSERSLKRKTLKRHTHIYGQIFFDKNMKNDSFTIFTRPHFIMYRI